VIVLNTERIKSIVLILLVSMSFVLTTRIWFYISIEGLFVIPSNNQTLLAEDDYEKENLIKPSKLVVHTGQNQALLSNNQKDKEHYTFILNASKDILRDWMNYNESYSLTSLKKDQLQEIRHSKAVELIFEYPMQLSSIKSLLDIDKNSWNEVNDIDAIIIAPYDNKMYIVDDSKGSIYQFTSLRISTVLRGVISDIEKRNDYAHVFLNEVVNESYGNNAMAPVSIETMPALTVRGEVEKENKIDPEIMKFFNDDISNIISMKDAAGKVTFTDREEETVTIDAQGALEYYKYNVAPDDIKSTDVNEAIDIATQYVSQHMGFTYDFYLSGVESSTQGGRKSYIISYDYKYNGTPIITELETGRSAIEVEILGQEVKRYKRNVRVIEDQGQTVKIIHVLDILDLVWGGLNERLYTTKSEAIVLVNDIYLAYFERNVNLVPVWVVDVTVEGSNKVRSSKKYVIGAEEGVILEEK
jgi:regulatory protein YycH of two-component signal transduction system YycFG